MTWLTILQALISVAASLIGWLKGREQLDAGRAEVIAANLAGALAEIEKANAARDAVRGSLERDPASLRNDDGFKRDD